MADDKDEAETPDESDSSATPDEPQSDGQSEEHAAAEGSREPTLEELEQMLEGDDPDDHDGAEIDPADEPSELADSVDGDDSHDSDDDSGDDGDPDGELVSVGAAPKSRSTAAAGDAETGTSVAARKDRQKKDRATPRQKREVEKPKRTTPAGFVREAVGELRKVVYPTGPQLGNYFVVVLVFVLFIIAFVGVLDTAFGALIVKVLG